MDPGHLPLVIAKLAALAILILTSACGARIGGSQGDASGDAPARNELVLITDGSYGVSLRTENVQCRRLVGDQVEKLAFRQADGPDAGLEVELLIAGDPAAGDELAAASSDTGRFFTFRLTRPNGGAFRYTSAGAAGTALIPSVAKLTMIQAKAEVSEGRLMIVDLPPAAPPAQHPGQDALTVNASFRCEHWEN